MTTKELNVIDLNLFSGSAEKFRTAVGNYYEIVSGTYGEVPTIVELSDTNEYAIMFLETDGIVPNVDMEETISDEVIIPNKRFPMRFYGNTDNELDPVESDLEWKARFLGGTVGDKTYKSIYSENVYDNYSFAYTLPYSQLEIENSINGSSFTDIVKISYNYNRHLAEYEKYIENIDERLIPNLYLLKSYESYNTASAAQAVSSITASIVNFITREQNALGDEDATYFDFPTDVFESNDKALGWNSILLENDFASQYLTGSIIRYPLSASTRTIVSTVLQNLMFDNDVLIDSDSPFNTLGDVLPSNAVDFDGDEDTEDSETHSLTYKGKFPFYITFDFDFDVPSTNTTFAESIVTHSFSQRFLKLLKESFLEENSVLVPESREYAYNITYEQGADVSSTVEETYNQSFRSIDFMDMLAYAHNNYISTMNNCYFVGGESFNRKAAMDSSGVYRYANTINTLGVLSDTVDFLNDESNFEIKALSDAYEMESTHRETLAYRIEKVGGIPTGDSRTQNVLQNFWIFNSPEAIESGLNFYDSQVKYGTGYTYNIYAYVAVLGRKYNFSDLRLTRHIGSASIDESTLNCLEFYNPSTENPAVQLMEEWEDNKLSGSNTYASNAQVASEYNYLADCYLNYEPTLRIFEVPVFSKGLKVQDNPPNNMDITVRQIEDNSRKIGFFISHETFYQAAGDVAGMLYPTPISVADGTIKEDYLNARDHLSGSYLKYESVSRQRYLEVYRAKEKPTAMSDFDGTLIDTIDLRIKNTKYTESTVYYENRVRLNQKYYYVFRFLNEHNMPGQSSDIYEIQMVNDGGYNYLITNILFEKNLSEATYTNPFTQFKKLIELTPNISHLLLNTEEADLTDTATSQIGNITVGHAEDLIWDKQFKLRLTSKKTGKKIDLNITYNLQSE